MVLILKCSVKHDFVVLFVPESDDGVVNQVDHECTSFAKFQMRAGRRSFGLFHLFCLHCAFAEAHHEGFFEQIVVVVDVLRNRAGRHQEERSDMDQD